VKHGRRAAAGVLYAVTQHPLKAHWWYESIVDWMLMNPHKTKADCAKFFNVSKQWIYVLSQSDVFKALYESRRKAHAGMVSGAVIEKTEALTEMALDHLTARVAEQGDMMTPGFLKDLTEMGLEKLGYNGKSNVVSPTQIHAPVNVNIVTADALEEARRKMIERGERLAAVPQREVVNRLSRETPDAPSVIDSFATEEK
jgi:hypothetical protein